MIELLTKEKLGMLKPGTISFLIKFAIKELSEEKATRMKEKLENKKLCFENGCYYYLDIEYSEDETMVGVIVYLPDSKWPDDKHKQEKIMENYVTTFSSVCKDIIDSVNL